MDGQMKKRNPSDGGLSRREFLEISRRVVLSAGVCAGVGGVLPGLVSINDALAAMPVSGGYLLVDRKKCQGCVSCMLACSLVHEGTESLALSRIQIIQDSFKKFPDDLDVAQCRQCVDPACVKACPSEALAANPKHGSIRMVDAAKCTGCKACIEACPHTPGRVTWNAEKETARICDLCAEAPFWNQAGGPGGRQACVEVCPVGAIVFSDGIPVQEGESGYQVNLRGQSWKNLGYPVD